MTRKKSLFEIEMEREQLVTSLCDAWQKAAPPNPSELLERLHILSDYLNGYDDKDAQSYLDDKIEMAAHIQLALQYSRPIRDIFKAIEKPVAKNLHEMTEKFGLFARLPKMDKDDRISFYNLANRYFFRNLRQHIPFIETTDLRFATRKDKKGNDIEGWTEMSYSLIKRDGVSPVFVSNKALKTNDISNSFNTIFHESTHSSILQLLSSNYHGLIEDTDLSEHLDLQTKRLKIREQYKIASAALYYSMPDERLAFRTGNAIEILFLLYHKFGYSEDTNTLFDLYFDKEMDCIALQDSEATERAAQKMVDLGFKRPKLKHPQEPQNFNPE